jgi:hypothetical protein
MYVQFKLIHFWLVRAVLVRHANVDGRYLVNITAGENQKECKYRYLGIRGGQTATGDGGLLRAGGQPTRRPRHELPYSI